MFLARNLTLNVAAAPNYKYVFSKRLETLESKNRRSEVKTLPKRKKKKKKKKKKNGEKALSQLHALLLPLLLPLLLLLTTTTTITTADHRLLRIGECMYLISA